MPFPTCNSGYRRDWVRNAAEGVPYKKLDLLSRREKPRIGAVRPDLHLDRVQTPGAMP